MSHNRLRIGIVGIGAIGKHHLNAFERNPRCEVRAVCDQSEDWVEHIQHQHRIQLAFTSWEDLVACDEVDAVAVCLPTVFHKPVTVAALQAGKHVLCEKPMAVTTAEARCMADAAAKSGRILLISFNQRFDSEIQFLKRFIEDGGLGDIYFVRTAWRRPMGMLPAPKVERPTGAYSRNWFNERAMGGGVTLDLGSHIVDLAMYLMGFPVLRDVVGVAYTKFLPEFLAGTEAVGDADDHMAGFVRFQNGASMQVEASFGCYVEKEVIEQVLYGDKGGAHREAGAPLKLFSAVAGAYTTVLPRINTQPLSPIDHFIECILEGKPPLITPEQGVAVTEILEAIRCSTPQ